MVIVDRTDIADRLEQVTKAREPFSQWKAPNDMSILKVWYFLGCSLTQVMLSAA